MSTPAAARTCVPSIRTGTTPSRCAERWSSTCRCCGTSTTRSPYARWRSLATRGSPTPTMVRARNQRDHAGEPNVDDASNGYESVAAVFVGLRDPMIGAGVVREWARALPAGASVLDLGCGHGVPISMTLMREGIEVFGVD